MSWTLITVLGALLLGAALIYGTIRNKGRNSPADIARTDAAAERARDETDRETED